MKMFTTIAAIAALAIGLAGCSHTLSAEEQRTAEFGGLKYAQAAGADFVSCSGIDSDNDGYVTCGMKTRVAQGETPVITEILCSFANGAGGCKRKG